MAIPFNNKHFKSSLNVFFFTFWFDLPWDFKYTENKNNSITERSKIFKYNVNKTLMSNFPFFFFILTLSAHTNSFPVYVLIRLHFERDLKQVFIVNSVIDDYYFCFYVYLACWRLFYFFQTITILGTW